VARWRGFAGVAWWRCAPRVGARVGGAWFRGGASPGWPGGGARLGWALVWGVPGFAAGRVLVAGVLWAGACVGARRGFVAGLRGGVCLGQALALGGLALGGLALGGCRGFPAAYGCGARARTRRRYDPLADIAARAVHLPPPWAPRDLTGPPDGNHARPKAGWRCRFAVCGHKSAVAPAGATAGTSAG
jgi:hypothetical protein